MKLQILLCLVAMAVMVSARPEQYTDKFDNVNLDEILSNRRLLMPYLKCITDEGKCTPDGKELKKHIKEALQEDCAKCTTFQKNNSNRVMAKVINEEPAYWEKIKAKYDPQNAFSSKYEKDLKKN
ncbi:allergen Tha p 1-like [Pieris rapae]|uniref:allergen Tha p 1-like n=1 Tax=Pieris rapae TaxID=64459 RepID=UPI001E27CA9F|nr:allergen Tha p 1-like [Pieris rapae]